MVVTWPSPWAPQRQKAAVIDREARILGRLLAIPAEQIPQAREAAAEIARAYDIAQLAPVVPIKQSHDALVQIIRAGRTFVDLLEKEYPAVRRYGATATMNYGDVPNLSFGNLLLPGRFDPVTADLADRFSGIATAIRPVLDIAQARADRWERKGSPSMDQIVNGTPADNLVNAVYMMLWKTYCDGAKPNKTFNKVCASVFRMTTDTRPHRDALKQALKKFFESPVIGKQ
jgi:hypothetical protein